MTAGGLDFAVIVTLTAPVPVSVPLALVAVTFNITEPAEAVSATVNVLSFSETPVGAVPSICHERVAPVTGESPFVTVTLDAPKVKLLPTSTVAVPFCLTVSSFSAHAVGTNEQTIAIASRSDSNLLFKDFIKFLPFSCQRGPAPRGILLPVRPTIPDHCEGPVSKLYLFCNDS